MKELLFVCLFVYFTSSVDTKTERSTYKENELSKTILVSVVIRDAICLVIRRNYLSLKGRGNNESLSIKLQEKKEKTMLY